MPYLLDTNVISEQTKPQPDPGVLEWLEQHGVSEAYLSVVTLGEIEQGIQLLGSTKRARAYELWLKKLEQAFEGRVLSVDRRVASTWAQITARAISRGKTLRYADSIIAAIGLTHDLTIVTRNTADFNAVTTNLINPWTAS
jgi:toxin FitB